MDFSKQGDKKKENGRENDTNDLKDPNDNKDISLSVKSLVRCQKEKI